MNLPLQHKNIRCLTFDLDETLWPLHETLITAEKAANAYVHKHGPEFAAAFRRENLAAIRRELLTSKPDLSHQLTELRYQVYYLALESGGASGQQAEQLARKTVEHHLHHRSLVQPFPGVDELLSRLSDTYLLGAITNGNVRFDDVAISRHFGFFISAEMIGASKPANPMFSAAIEHSRRLLGSDIKPDQLLHIGDDLITDVSGANAAGLLSCWLNTGGSSNQSPPEEDALLIPDLMIRELEDLEKHLP